MKPKIVPAILVKNKKALDKQLALAKGLTQEVQIDFIDGKFAKNVTIKPSALPKSKIISEAHLMVKRPCEWVKALKGKVKTIIFHLEVCRNKKDALNIIECIKKNKQKVGIAINPDTHLRRLWPYYKLIDKVLVMTVHPGFQQQQFMPEALRKVKEIRKKNPKLDISVDGGINIRNAKQCAKAGATSINSGSYIFKKGKANKKEVKERIALLKKEVQ